MDGQVKQYFSDLEAEEKDVQYEAYKNIIAETEKEVDWAYEVWNQLLEGLKDGDNHKRSRAAQFLAHLAISDPEKRILSDFPALWKVTYDEKFVTARHALNSVWRIGLAGEEQLDIVLEHLDHRFKNSINEKNYTLIRFDIIQGLRHLYDAVEKPKIKYLALDLIGLEENPKYKKKYAALFRNT
ncbi:hypothetical protein [Virgibacillus sp. YIM 98842]|uniref:hypothetical protein n=1 Tax=Virgibacillus sp. YIM 98842 TaxID=2663533 RepID=UPI0013DC80FC|nr:hypothetical protein [Virgibacillus sp. YIM 98842]